VIFFKLIIFFFHGWPFPGPYKPNYAAARNKYDTIAKFRFWGGGGVVMFRAAVALFPSSVNTRVNRPALQAHLHPVLSLKEFVSLRVECGW
jgi:hypothetical protein